MCCGYVSFMLHVLCWLCLCYIVSVLFAICLCCDYVCYMMLCLFIGSESSADELDVSFVFVSLL